MTDEQIPEPDYNDQKELYAFFGLTFYHVQVLEQGLVNLAVALQAKGIGNVTVRDVNDLFGGIEGKTFGNVLNAARKLTRFPASIDTDLQTALNYRNYLAHKFFVVHSRNMLTRAGQVKMIEELRSMLKFILLVDAEFDKVWIAAWGVLGVDQKWFEKQFERIQQMAQSNSRKA
jgi:hypothetical protein